jgi:uncharacterized protein (UPF0335 family)
MLTIGPSLLEKIQTLEHENIETSNCLHEIYTNLKTLENKLMYENLSQYERSLARFGDKVALIAGLEITDKISPEDAYQQIKELYRELKSLRKKERRIWGNSGIGTTQVL